MLGYGGVQVGGSSVLADHPPVATRRRTPQERAAVESFEGVGRRALDARGCQGRSSEDREMAQAGVVVFAAGPHVEALQWPTVWGEAMIAVWGRDA
jgi:hypothetical protein